MRVGVSTACLFPTDLEQALRRFAEQGIDFCECFFNTPSELKEDSLHRMKTLVDSHKMGISSVHSFHSEMETFYFFTNYKNRVEDGIELYRQYYEAAAKLGAKYLIFHGDYAARLFAPYSEEQAFENIRQLWSVGKEYGVELLHENVCRCKGGHPDYLLRLHEAIPELGFVLDCKQALRASHHPMEFVEALGSSIRHVHLSDSLIQDGTIIKDCLPPGQGNFDFRRFFSALAQRGAEPSIIIELYSNSFKTVEDLVESWRFVQRELEVVDRF